MKRNGKLSYNHHASEKRKEEDCELFAWQINILIFHCLGEFSFSNSNKVKSLKKELWRELWAMDANRIKSIVGATYD